jgi:DNA mismatch repair ATPase MutS
VETNVFQRAYELRVIARLAGLLERQRFESPRLAGLVAGISEDGRAASQHVRRLVRLVDWFESRRNQLFGVIAWALLLPEQLAFAIEAWRARHGGMAVRWLAAIGEMEALASLATFAFEHPEYPFPKLETGAEAPKLAAAGLGHPLIPAKVRVTNDVGLDAACRILVVTGSNMSGKSTLLRSVGVNVALAQAGAPVCATQMTLTPLQIGASLRAQDSLEQGVSRFFAEIKRLQAILAMAKGSPPVLFLLDEILNGTNSHDRREGADAVVRKLLERGAIGLLTTHDLALSALVDSAGVRGANIHFQDTLEGDKLLFDYKIRPGVVTRRNALDLMRMVGIELPGDAGAGAGE